jgi:AbrB family looped-hinge helix DNA binding protein
MALNMASEIVKVDDKGRVLIPEDIREAGGIEPGAPLQVVDLGKGMLVLRKLELPSKEEILKICRETRREIFKGRVEPWLKETLESRK